MAPKALFWTLTELILRRVQSTTREDHKPGAELPMYVPHVLSMLDCYFAAIAATDTTESTTKGILAACGRESQIHGVGQRSFTSALIEEMQAFDHAALTAALLHSLLVTMKSRLAFTYHPQF